MNKNPSVPEEEKTSKSGLNRDDLLDAAHDLGQALESAKQRSQKWLAWQKLNSNEEAGETNGISHSQEAIALLERALDWNEDDSNIIHHLAIAYHSLAWDLEGCEPDKAFPAWKKALYYWRKLQFCGPFWRDLCAKGESLGEAFEKSEIDEFRKNIIRSLLEIHVDFIRHYYELKKPLQASRHIHLIEQAQISPADRNHFEVLVYQAMTSTVPNLLVEGYFADALSILDHFLDLFPAYPPALQCYLEVTKQWVEQMSPSSQWEEILKLDKQALPKWDTLNASEHLHKYPLANTALSDLAGVLGEKHFAIAKSLRLQDRKAGRALIELEGEEYHAYVRAILWLGKAEDLSADNFEVKPYLYNALLLRADFTARFFQTTDQDDVNVQLLDQALSDCQWAMKVIPDEKTPREMAGKIQQLKAEYRLRHLPDGLDAKEFVAHLKNVEEDLENAIQFNPKNHSLKEMLENIRETLRESETTENPVQ